MTTLKLLKWDSAEHLKTEEDMALYLEACLQEAGDDAAFIAKALGTIARAKGMSQLTRETGVSAQSTSFSDAGIRDFGDASTQAVRHAAWAIPGHQ